MMLFIQTHADDNGRLMLTVSSPRNVVEPVDLVTFFNKIWPHSIPAAFTSHVVVLTCGGFAKHLATGRGLTELVSFMHR